MRVKIASIEGLINAAKNRKAVYCDSGWLKENCKPASFILNLPTVQVYKLLKQGLYIYNKEEKTNGNKT